jgi:hypothetical protein
MKRNVVLHSSLPPYAVADTLRQSIDEEHLTIFSLSGYRGDRPVLGKVDERTFRLQKRRYYKNSFAPFFYGQFEPEPGGTRIEGYFGRSLCPHCETLVRAASTCTGTGGLAF